MAFRKKAEFILTHKPDILIIVECEHPDKLLYKGDIPKPTDSLWFGKNQHKGLAIFSYGDYRFKIHENHNENFKMIIPIEVTGGHFDFNLFLVWAYNPDDNDGRYITQVWKAITHYDELLTGKPTMFIGDFNSNTIWDNKKHRLGSHSSVVKKLEDKGNVTRARVVPCHIVAVDQNLPAAHRLQPGDHAQRRRLAAARRAEQCDKLAIPNRQVHRLHGVHITEFFCYLV